MPYKNTSDKLEASRRGMRLYRARKQAGDPEWREKEKDRKARWYAENKRKKDEAQQRNRSKLNGSSDIVLPALSRADRKIASEIASLLKTDKVNLSLLGERMAKLSEEGRGDFLMSAKNPTRALLRNCYRAALGLLHDDLIAVAGRGAQAMRKLPIEEQNRCMEKISVAKEEGYMRIAFSDLTREQVSQVFEETARTSRVRTLTEQRDYRNEEKKNL